jgi:imidazole glycerol phosphate synthase subunit HisF
LDVDDGRVVKGIKFKGIQDAGDPVELARRYNDDGADELTFLDIGASYKSRATLLDVVRKVAAEVFIPLCVGGGIRSVDDMREAMNAGADKVSVCTSALAGAGYDLELTRTILDAVPVPVIASGGAGNLEQIADVLLPQEKAENDLWGNAGAALVASMLHYGKTTIWDIKKYAESKGVCVRW